MAFSSILIPIDERGRYRANYIVSDIYPIYCSVKQYRTSDCEAYSLHWHKYWILRSVLLVIESILTVPLIVSLPLYTFLSVFRGTELIYNALLPLFLNNEQEIDSAVDKIKSCVTDFGAKVLKRAKTTARKAAADLLKQSLEDNED